MVATLRHTAPRLGNCVRCWQPKAATTSMELRFGAEEYRLRLCETHAELMQTQMFAWTRVAELLLPFPRPNGESSSKLRVRIPDPIAVEEAPAEEPATPQWREEIGAEYREMAEAMPGVKEWRLSRKARERADEQDVHLLTVLLAAEAPSEIEPSTSNPDAFLHTRGDVTAIVVPTSKTVLTVFRRSEERVRGYQAS